MEKGEDRLCKESILMCEKLSSGGAFYWTFGTVTIGVAKPLPCSTVVGGDKANGHSVHSSQKVEYFTKILRLIMSLHRDIMELQLQCSRDVAHYPRPPRPAYGISPKLKAEIAMK
ncbi:unnamed protein product, partial [Iphiclides podalirius]